MCSERIDIPFRSWLSDKTVNDAWSSLFKSCPNFCGYGRDKMQSAGHKRAHKGTNTVSLRQWRSKKLKIFNRKCTYLWILSKYRWSIFVWLWERLKCFVLNPGEMSLTHEQLITLKRRQCTYQTAEVSGWPSSSHAFCLAQGTPAERDPPADVQETLSWGVKCMDIAIAVLSHFVFQVGLLQLN